MSSGLIDTSNGVLPAVEDSPAVVSPGGTVGHRWAVVLAGGDGTRLQDLTLKIAGDLRPKQFCSIFGGETLLAQTRARLESLFHVDRELFVVTRSPQKHTIARSYGTSTDRVLSRNR